MYEPKTNPDLGPSSVSQEKSLIPDGVKASRDMQQGAPPAALMLN